MVLILDSGSKRVAHIWSKSGIFDLLMAFGYIERVIKCDVRCSELPSYISTMGTKDNQTRNRERERDVPFNIFCSVV